VTVERRTEVRQVVNLEFASVDEFINEYVTNISRSGVFIKSDDPLPIGTRVIAEGPCGGLIAGAGWAGPVALIAGGIGITPLRALFASAPCAENAITLVYRVHDPADIIFRAELQRIAAQRGGTVHFLIGGRGDPRNDLSPASLTRLCPDLAWSRVFVCGPAGYAQTIRASLASLGVPSGRVRSESFQM